MNQLENTKQVRHETIRLAIVIITNKNWSMIHLDVKYVFLNGSCSNEIMKFRKVLMNEFEITDLGNKKRFELTNCKTAITPVETNHKLNSDAEGDDVDAITFKQLVGSLRYLCNTRPNIYYAVGMVSRFMNKPKWSHYQVVVRILRYIKGTLKYGVLFPSGVKS
ncbi:uncharacterized mitochondrial protein AtMg00810-like [Lathyrus oleraceus]|uniref:uncharacterized mitochondrial protein AtMg00810-like n=1 Tax=Pisum sativum TaxID=3888 RepID=UPI0021CEF814|nr:uncharacterized mitochondrial protein AtMg00810-like [Pisum sativum]